MSKTPSPSRAQQLWDSGKHRDAHDEAKAYIEHIKETTQVGQNLMLATRLVKRYNEEQGNSNGKQTSLLEPYVGVSDQIRQHGAELIRSRPGIPYDSMIDGIVRRLGGDEWTKAHRAKVCAAMSTGEKDLKMFVRDEQDRWYLPKQLRLSENVW